MAPAQRTNTVATLTRTGCMTSSTAFLRRMSSTSAAPTSSPAAPSAASSASASSTSASSSSPDLSDPATRDRLYGQARFHRRAKLWLVALFTGAAAVVTTWRHFDQEAKGVEEIAEARRRIEQEKKDLETLCVERDQRREKVRSMLDSIAPPPKSAAAAASATSAVSSAPASIVVPNTFLAAAVQDVRRTLSLAPTEDTVLLTPSLMTAVATKPKVDEVKKQQRGETADHATHAGRQSRMRDHESDARSSLPCARLFQ
jgi:hypothetical protein